MNTLITSQRLASIDAFRGATIAGMIIVINPGSWKYIYPSLRHADWNGLTMADLVFPFFLFIVGVSITFSLSNSLKQEIPKKDLYVKIIKRTIILFVLGLFINTFPSFDLANIRIMGVLQRIALCYLIVSIIFLNSRLLFQFCLALILLFIYWALMEWIYIPGIGSGVYEKGNNVAAYLDRFVLSGHMGYYEKIGEPEGFISTIPSLSTTLFGTLTGLFLKMKKGPYLTTIIIFSAGILGILIGLFWSQWLPINKNLWTSSYATLTTGLGMVVFSFFYLFIDVLNYKKTVKAFIVFGTNAITVYVLSIVIAKLISLVKVTGDDGNSYHIRAIFYDNTLSPVFGNYNASLLYALLYTLIWCGIMWVFYEKKIFIKV